jgi:hypothetical protein
MESVSVGLSMTSATGTVVNWFQVLYFYFYFLSNLNKAEAKN